VPTHGTPAMVITPMKKLAINETNDYLYFKMIFLSIFCFFKSIRLIILIREYWHIYIYI